MAGFPALHTRNALFLRIQPAPGYPVFKGQKIYLARGAAGGKTVIRIPAGRLRRGKRRETFFSVRFRYSCRSNSMDTATKRQLSIGLFVIGFAMIFVQDLKRLDSINLGFTWPFAIMFYLGLICMAAGYCLK
jgi:hypothetical protein